MIGQDWINRARLYLLAGQSEERNKLSTAYTAGVSTTLSFQYPMRSIQAGTRLSCGLNTFYVWDVNNNTATVTGGEDGGTDISLAQGAVVRVRPRWTDYEIWTAIGEDMLELSSPTHGLFGVNDVIVPYLASVGGYDLVGANSIIAIDSVRYDATGDTIWPTMGPTNWELIRDPLKVDFPSGFGLFVYYGPWNSVDLKVTYRQPFTVPTDPTADVSATLLPSTANDLPPMGAVVRLVSSREIRRNQIETQPDTRRAAEVGPGAVAASYRGVAQMRAMRIMQEAARLSAAYPIIKDFS